MSTLNYKHLHYFWFVAKEGGISAAARKLGMTAQTISGQVSLLEQACGQTLFNQVGRKLELTESGRTMLHYADRIFLLGEELQQVLEQGSNVRSRLNIGIVDAIPKSIAQQLLSPLCDATVKLICIDGQLDELSAKLALHQLDIVLADKPASNAETLRLQSQALVYAPIMLLGTPELVARYENNFPQSLNGAPLLLPTRNSALRLQLDVWFAEHHITPDIVGEFADSALMKTFAQTGIGLYPSPVIASKPIPNNELISLGHLSGVVAQYHAIFSPKKIMHPAISRILAQ